MRRLTAILNKACLLVALIAGAPFLGELLNRNVGAEELKTAQSTFGSTTVPQCTGATASGVRYGIRGAGINVRKGPGTNHDKIVNKKATQAIGETFYIQVDNSVTVLEVCHKGDWSYIEVVDPAWLKDSHKGWIATRFLRKQSTDSDGFRTFTEEDFIWDAKIAPYKDIIVAGVNKIHREHSGCEKIDPSSAYHSASRSSPGKPVFFVTCGSGYDAFNVWFSKDDL